MNKSSEKSELASDKMQFNLTMKKILKSFAIFLLLYYKAFYPIFIPIDEEEKIDNIFPLDFNSQNEIHFAKLYFEICQNGTLFGETRYKRNLNPKFSIIIPVYNREKYITRVLRSIQNQSYKNIEIIFVDDNSEDNSVKLIEEYKRKDKRINLIKHKTNKGTLITRNDGALSARGEYVIFVDPDDILYEGILKKLAGNTEIYDVDVIRFDAFFRRNSYIGKYEYGNMFKRNTIITQPEIFQQSFYQIGDSLYQQNLFLWGKIIKRQLFLEIFDNLTDYYKKQSWTLYEDNAFDFILLKYAQSYVFIKENGYIYCQNSQSSYSDRYKPYKANRTVKDVFLLAEICFDYTNDNEYEKKMAGFQLRRFIYEYKECLDKVTEGFDYYYRVLNKFLKCKYIIPKHRRYFEEIKAILENTEKRLNQ